MGSQRVLCPDFHYRNPAFEAAGLDQVSGFCYSVTMVMKMLHFAVCDDEPYMLDALSAQIVCYLDGEGCSGCRISRFPSGQALLDGGERFDLVFLDIRMDPPDGLETAGTLRRQGDNALLVFMTVLRESVFDAFEVQTFDYLLKPPDPTPGSAGRWTGRWRLLTAGRPGVCWFSGEAPGRSSRWTGSPIVRSWAGRSISIRRTVRSSITTTGWRRWSADWGTASSGATAVIS